jgi:hypothetical protein
MRPATALFVIGALSQASAQAPRPVPTQPPPQFDPRGTEQIVTVEGCLYGNRLKPDPLNLNTRRIFELLDARELRLDGPKELTQDIEKAHWGHQDEITGAVLVPGDRDVSVGSTRVGTGTRVSGGTSGPGRDPVGTTPARNPIPESQRWLVIKVTSLRHLADKCSVPDEVPR